MRCKLCGIAQHVQKQTHSWITSQHCSQCHFMGKVPRGRKAKNYAKQ